MHGFGTQDVVEKDTFFTMWRQGSIVGMWTTGVIDDARSDRWRKTMLAHFASHGWPRFVAMDSSTADPRNSITSRLRLAAFVREGARRVEWTGILTGVSAAPLVVVRTVLRVAGVPNISVFTDEAVFDRALEQCRRGRRPSATGDATPPSIGSPPARPNGR